MLIHMTPGEVGGLEALARAHGGMLTTNPDTGLPEASFLKSILPTLAGAAITIGSGGTINPLTAGMLVGGFEGLRTGDLGKGLMAGLGAWGGAGLGQGLAGLGAAGAEGIAGQLGAEGAKTGAQSQAAQLAAQTAGTDAAFQAANQEAIRGAAAQTMGSTFAPAMSSWDQLASGAKTLTEPGGLSSLAGQMGGTSDLIKSGAAAAAPMMMGAMQPEQLQAPDVDKGNIRPFDFTRTQNQQAYQRAPGDTSEQNYFTNTYTPRPMYAAASGGQVPRYMDGGLLPPPSEPAYDTSLRYANGGTVDDEQGSDDIPGYFMGTLIKDVVNKAKGIASNQNDDGLKRFDYDPATQLYTPIQNQNQQDQNPAGTNDWANSLLSISSLFNKKSNNNDLPSFEYNPESQNYTKLAGGGFMGQNIGGGNYGSPQYEYASGGLTALRQGKFLSGGGDGMSDSIPATINGNQPARLADGEFVVPADVVSHIGNGSSKAGAKKLYGMMDKVRKARTGKKSQAPEINPRKYMPA
jgi:hypothetical protein